MTTSRVAQREHHWDAIRALLMLLGIPYHVAMAYRANDVWIVNAREGALIWTWLADFIHVFRMPAFFLIAGYFAALLLSRRSSGEWLKGRFLRLGIPFLACLLTLNPLLNLFCELSNFSIGPALASWEHNSSVSGGYWVRHLWFIIVLLQCSALAALLTTLSPRLSQAQIAPATDFRLARRPALVVLLTALVLGAWEASAIELFYAAGFATNVPQQIFRLDQLLQFIPWFAAGCLVARAPRLRDALHRPSFAIALLGVLALAAHFMFKGQLHPAAGRLVETVAAVAITQMLLAGVKHVADRPHPAVQELVRASFVIYLFHLPITAALVVIGQPLALPVSVKAVLAILLTLGLSWMAWRIVLRSPMLRLLYDGVPPAVSPRPALPLAARDLRRQSL
ncbi:acyltransferase family protein [Sphingobium lignivorans]|uniref:Glucan biosynthesis protein C n=1 Tax=Sphingobium lignivorans TaxID=2735886 RepID=A0ABR6NIC3_9SPHN|nr:acyltransferase family protein [Sphingobium lignivorans]MBB5987011.1 glucan biosynthesis protein C [Sphingobium lignivorans]